MWSGVFPATALPALPPRAQLVIPLVGGAGRLGLPRELVLRGLGAQLGGPVVELVQDQIGVDDHVSPSRTAGCRRFLRSAGRRPAGMGRLPDLWR